MTQLPELLAPAGGMDHIKAAVENGADAVYMGGRFFNARRNAANFDDDEMRRAVEYAHVRGVNIYITMNTLIADREMRQAVDEAGKAWLAGADALIVQDLGFASLLRKHIPGLPLHISTQGTVTSAEGIRALAPLGFSRAILARELTIEEITETARQSPVPVEVFAHGALCVCYSGQCLMSSLIGGRSGNRGRCAQPCRLPYQLGQERGYLLSPKDLCSLSMLPELVGSGVAALKIEGRMKSPEYVAVVTSVYRRHLDRCAEAGPYRVDEADMADLLQIFNRGGFTAGYLKGRPGGSLVCPERPKHWGVPIGTVTAQDRANGTVEANLTGALRLGDGVEIDNEALPGNIVTSLKVRGAAVREAGPGRVSIGNITGPVKPGDRLYRTSSKEMNERAAATWMGKPRRKVLVSGSFIGCTGEPLRLSVRDGNEYIVTVQSEGVAEVAVTLPLTGEAARAQLTKTGDSPFEFKQINIELDGKASVKLSELNGLRREALAALEHARADRYPGREANSPDLEAPGAPAKPAQAGLSLFFWQWSDGHESLFPLADRVYVPFQAIGAVLQCTARSQKMMAWLPPVTNGVADGLIRDAAPQWRGMGLDGVLIGNAGHIEMLRDAGLPLYGGASMNAFNGWTMETLARLGLQGVTLSHELTMEQIEQLPDAGIEKEAVIYGRLPLMTSAYCPVGGQSGKPGGKCGRCAGGEAFAMTDRIGAKFPIVCDPVDCRCTILNGDVLSVPGLAPHLAAAGVGMLRLMLYNETPEQAEALAALCRQALEGGPAEGPRGRGTTKGHYFRGVLE